MSESLRVLLVEDNPGDCRLVERLLAVVPEVDFRLRTVGSLEAAFRFLEREPVEVVLLDLTLPDSDAGETFHRLHERVRGTPIVVLTGRQDRRLALRAVRGGAHDVLAKRTLDSDRLCRALLFSVERRDWLDELQGRVQRYALAFDGTEDGLWDWDLESGAVYFSPAWRRIFGLEEEAAAGTIDDWLDRVHPEDRENLLRDIEDHRQGKIPRLHSEHRVRLRSGHYRWLLARGRVVLDEMGTARRLVGSLSDIHERKLNEARLEHDALHDALTGLANATLLRDRVSLTIAQAKRRRGHRFALLYLDLDRFKSINDRLGHTAGDEVLVSVARRLRQVLRPGDTLARLGGDEFAILAHSIDDPRHASRLAERVHAQFEAPFEVGEQQVECGASIGITLLHEGYRTAAEVLRDSDTAMYRAKALGRGSFVIFDEEMQRSTVEQLRLEQELRRAVERGEFQLHYQPILSLSSGRIEGFEALLRWLHPRRGLIYPADFMDLAEETGLILPIGWHVLQEACRQMAIWRHRYENGPLMMSINLSPRQFLESALLVKMDEVLAETGLPPECLRLEIAERPLVENAEVARRQLAEIARRRVRVSIDDFGAGFSLLSSLPGLEADAIKIDRSLLERVRMEGEWSVVETLMGVARHLGMRTAAEGLETEEQVERLRELHCESVQGFYFSAPLDGAGAEALLAHQSDGQGGDEPGGSTG